jgi:hypothetical protein
VVSSKPVELFLDSGVTGEIGISNQPDFVHVKRVHRSIFKMPFTQLRLSGLKDDRVGLVCQDVMNNDFETVL